jgi:hypothetical protein
LPYSLVGILGGGRMILAPEQLVMPFACQTIDGDPARPTHTWRDLRNIVAQTGGPVNFQRPRRKSDRTGVRRVAGMAFNQYCRDFAQRQQQGRCKASWSAANHKD